MKKKIFETNCRFDVFQKCTAHFSLLIGHFLSQLNEALLVLKDLQTNRPDKATYLAKHQKTGLCPWTQLPASPRTVYFRWCRSLTMLTTSRPEHQGGGRR